MTSKIGFFIRVILMAALVLLLNAIVQYLWKGSVQWYTAVVIALSFGIIYPFFLSRRKGQQ